MGGKHSSVAESLNDKNYDGADYLVDPDIAHGPLFNRKCTDMLCVLLLWVCLGSYAWTAHFAYTNGQPDKLLRPVNGDGQLCGAGALAAYPNLYYLLRTADRSPRAVCVDKCPLEIATPFKCHGTSRVKPADCENRNYYVGYGTIRVLKRFCLPDPDKLPKGFDDDAFDNIIGSFGLDDVQEIAEDIVEGKYAFVITFWTCVGVTLVYALMMYFLAGVLVWLSVIASGAGIFALAYMLQRHIRKNKGKKKKTKAADDKTHAYIQYAVYALYGLGVAFFVALCCLYKNIAISIAVLKTASMIVMRNIRVLFMPFCSGALLVLWTSTWIYGFILLVSCGKITQPTLGGQYKDIALTDELKYMLWFQAFVFFWVMEFIQAVFQYIVIVGVCTWYFTSTQDTRGQFSLLKGVWWSLRYNQGSLAFGSLLLAVVWILRLVFEFIDKQAEKAKENSSVAKCVSASCRCCLDCFHRFVKFLNENAYIQVALTGDNFCTAAMAAFILALKNSGSFLITNGVGTLISFLGKSTISIVNTAIGYAVINNVKEFKDDIDQPVPFLGLIFLMSFMMATTFMDVYSGISLAILQCLYADVDIAQQSNRNAKDSQNRPEEMNRIIAMITR